MSNKIKIEFIEEQLHKALQDIEKLKDANRETNIQMEPISTVVALCMFIAGG